MFRKNKVILFIFSLLITLGVSAFFIINKPQQQDLEAVKTKLNFTANELVSSFIADEKSIENKLSGELIEVEGIVKEITLLNNRYTVILQTSDKNSGIICDFNPKQINDFKQIAIGNNVKIKGICKGFLKDVVLLNCYLTSNQTNE